MVASLNRTTSINLNRFVTTNRFLSVYEELLRKAFDLEDILKSRNMNYSKREIRWSFREKRIGHLAGIFSFLEWLWHVHILCWVLRVTSVCCALLSIAVVWSELFFWIPYDVSIFSLLLKLKNISFMVQAGFLPQSGHFMM